jgi:hypothetical protein
MLKKLAIQALLEKLDQRKLAARQKLSAANPRPEGYTEAQIEECIEGWERFLSDTLHCEDDLYAIISSVVWTDNPLEVWLFQGGDGWLPDLFITKRWRLDILYEALAFESPFIEVCEAAAELRRLRSLYDRCGWKPHKLT